MIPILYSESHADADRIDNGLGRLSDCESCTVTEERNGEYTMELEYPINGIHADLLTPNRIIKVMASDKAGIQTFRVARVVPNMTTITVYANHISYDLCFYPVKPFAVHGGTTAGGYIDKIWENSVLSCPFQHIADTTTGIVSWKNATPKSVRAVLGSGDDSFLAKFGGEFEWDNMKVKWHTERGEDSGVSIRYGKNLLSIEQETNISETVCGVLAYWKKSESVVYGDIQYSSNASSFPFLKTCVIDVSGEFSSKPTKSALNLAAQRYITANNVGVPDVSTTVEFYPLQNTEEYARYADLEKVGLCDTVTVLFPALDVKAKAKVVKTVYDTLSERYVSVTLGTIKQTLADTVAGLMGSSMGTSGGGVAGNNMYLMYLNDSPSTSQSSGTLSSVPDISAFNLFYIEVCWSTGYTSHRAGTWVYVPEGSSVIAHPSVNWYENSAVAHVYRQVTINTANSQGSQVSLTTGTRATASGVTDGTSYAIVTAIIATTV